MTCFTALEWGDNMADYKLLIDSSIRFPQNRIYPRNVNFTNFYFLYKKFQDNHRNLENFVKNCHVIIFTGTLVLEPSIYDNDISWTEYQLCGGLSFNYFNRRLHHTLDNWKHCYACPGQTWFHRRMHSLEDSRYDVDFTSPKFIELYTLV